MAGLSMPALKLATLSSGPSGYPMQITTEQADRAVKAAWAKAGEIGVSVSVAVLDAGANMKAFSRMDGAWLGSADVAVKKARTSVLFENETQAVWEVCKPEAQAHGLELTNGCLVTFAGGIPLKAAGGQLLGAIGVSGGQVAQDYAIAQAAHRRLSALIQPPGSHAMSNAILITGAGSGLGEGAAIGLAQQGHAVIAAAQGWPQVTALRQKGQALKLEGLRVEKLDLLDPFDVRHAIGWDFDILVNNAGVAEGGPIAEIPVDLVRRNFEVNVFSPLAFTQGVIRRWVAEKVKGKVVFISSIGGLFSPPGFAAYAATKHAVEAIAEAMQEEVRPFGIQVQTINPGAYLTGFNEAMAENAFRWLDDAVNFTRRQSVHDMVEALIGTPQGRLDPPDMIARMIEVVPAREGKFRNLHPRRWRT